MLGLEVKDASRVFFSFSGCAFSWDELRGQAFRTRTPEGEPILLPRVRLTEWTPEEAYESGVWLPLSSFRTTPRRALILFWTLLLGELSLEELAPLLLFPFEGRWYTLEDLRLGRGPSLKTQKHFSFTRGDLQFLSRVGVEVSGSEPLPETTLRIFSPLSPSKKAFFLKVRIDPYQKRLFKEGKSVFASRGERRAFALLLLREAGREAHFVKLDTLQRTPVFLHSFSRSFKAFLSPLSLHSLALSSRLYSRRLREERELREKKVIVRGGKRFRTLPEGKEALEGLLEGRTRFGVYPALRVGRERLLFTGEELLKFWREWFSSSSFLPPRNSRVWIWPLLSKEEGEGLSPDERARVLVGRLAGGPLSKEKALSLGALLLGFKRAKALVERTKEKASHRMRKKLEEGRVILLNPDEKTRWLFTREGAKWFFLLEPPYSVIRFDLCEECGAWELYNSALERVMHVSEKRWRDEWRLFVSEKERRKFLLKVPFSCSTLDEVFEALQKREALPESGEASLEI